MQAMLHLIKSPRLVEFEEKLVKKLNISPHANLIKPGSFKYWYNLFELDYRSSVKKNIKQAWNEDVARMENIMKQKSNEIAFYQAASLLYNFTKIKVYSDTKGIELKMWKEENMAIPLPSPASLARQQMKTSTSSMLMNSKDLKEKIKEMSSKVSIQLPESEREITTSEVDSNESSFCSTIFDKSKNTNQSAAYHESSKPPLNILDHENFDNEFSKDSLNILDHENFDDISNRRSNYNTNARFKMDPIWQKIARFNDSRAVMDTMSTETSDNLSHDNTWSSGAILTQEIPQEESDSDDVPFAVPNEDTNDEYLQMKEKFFPKNLSSKCKRPASAPIPKTDSDVATTETDKRSTSAIPEPTNTGEGTWAEILEAAHSIYGINLDPNYQFRTQNSESIALDVETSSKQKTAEKILEHGSRHIKFSTPTQVAIPEPEESPERTENLESAKSPVKDSLPSNESTESGDLFTPPPTEVEKPGESPEKTENLENAKSPIQDSPHLNESTKNGNLSTTGPMAVQESNDVPAQLQASEQDRPLQIDLRHLALQIDAAVQMEEDSQNSPTVTSQIAMIQEAEPVPRKKLRLEISSPLNQKDLRNQKPQHSSTKTLAKIEFLRNLGPT